MKPPGRRAKGPQPGQVLANEADRLALLHLVATRVGYGAQFERTRVPWHEVSSALPALARAHGVATLAYESPAIHLVPEESQTGLAVIAQNEKLRGMWRLGITSRVISALEGVGIPTLVLKGQAFSVLAYGDWASRGGAADLDLLVAASHVSRTEAELRELGFSPRGEKPLPQSGSRLARYALWLHYERAWFSPELGSIDLHWRALPGGASWNAGANLFKHAVDVDLPIGSVTTLGPINSLIVACSQGESENWSRLKRLADLAAVQRICSPKDIAIAAAQSSLVTPSLDNQFARWSQLPIEPMANRSKVALISNLWHMRAGSGSRVDAVTRSTLGALLPARRLSRGRSALGAPARPLDRFPTTREDRPGDFSS